MSTLSLPSSDTTVATCNARPTAPPLGRLYEANGARLALHRAGEGGPAVVFLPGAGLIGLDFLNVQQEVARFSTSVTYDRGGTGWSDPVKLPRSAAEAAGELRNLLRAAGVAPPYLLVSHSLGGAHARRYAQLWPKEIAGLVFLDPADERYAAEPPRSLFDQLKMGLAVLPKLINARKFYRPMFATMFAAWPEALRETLIDYHVTNWARSLKEAGNLQTEVLPEIAAGGALPDVPLIVLTATGIDPFMAPFMPAPYLLALNERKCGYYDALARSVPHGENRLIDAGHSTLHTERPNAVVQAVRDVMAALRGSNSA
jgi:pimeloyl-ACP methyl ester carboxylesterase